MKESLQLEIYKSMLEVLKGSSFSARGTIFIYNNGQISYAGLCDLINTVAQDSEYEIGEILYIANKFRKDSEELLNKNLNENSYWFDYPKIDSDIEDRLRALNLRIEHLKNLIKLYEHE